MLIHKDRGQYHCWRTYRSRRCHWIANNDYVILQARYVPERTSDGKHEYGFPNLAIPEGTRYAMTVTFTFSGFNEPVEIEAPIITPAP